MTERRAVPLDLQLEIVPSWVPHSLCDSELHCILVERGKT